MKLKFNIFTIIILFLLSSCISEDLSKCEQCEGITLNFSYFEFDKNITKVNVGIFDKNDSIVETRLIDKNALANFRGYKTELDAGNYTAVCWANANENTQIDGFGVNNNYSEGKVYNPDLKTATPIVTNDSLFYGKIKFTVDDSRLYNGVVNLTPAFIRIKVCILGLNSIGSNTPTESYPVIRINNLSPEYNFDMQITDEYISHYPTPKFDSQNKRITAQSDVFRFNKKNDVTLDILDNSINQQTIETISIENFITDNKIEITDTNYVVIPILITIKEGAGGVISSVIVSLWEENIVIPEI